MTWMLELNKLMIVVHIGSLCTQSAYIEAENKTG